LSERQRNVAEGQGYPEEQPGKGEGGRAEDKPPREGAQAPRKHDDQADDHGKATGNPRSAG